MLYLGMDKDRERGDVPCVDENNSVTVLFYGQEIPVEKGATHIAADANGEVHCFWAEPIWYAGDCEWLMSCYSTKVRYCGEVDLEGMNWQDTCLVIITNA